MRHPRYPVVCILLIALSSNLQSVRGEITGITGSSSATVIQFGGLGPVQSDFSQVIVPLTAPEPPALSQAQVEIFDENDAIVAAGQAVSLFSLPNLEGLGNPNDVALDIGAFTDDTDTQTGWFVQGTATERRTIVINQSEEAVGNVFTSVSGARSRVILSGILFVAAGPPTKDLSGVDSRIRIRVTKQQIGLLPETLLEGEVVLSGGPNGEVEITTASGAFEGILLPVIDFFDFFGPLPDITVARAVPFAGLVLPYEYEYVPGQPFDLELSVISEARAVPGGSGAGAVFGMPQQGFASILQRIKQDDSGARFSEMIDSQVDTTGAAYANPPGFPFLTPFCGATGVAQAGLILMATGVLTRLRRRRRRR